MRQQEPIQPGSTYIVQEGDSLASVAQRAYHSESQWMVIYNANLRLLHGGPNLIQPGDTLYIPPQPDSSSYKEQVLLRMRNYDRQCSRMRVIQNVFQLIIFIGAATITVVASIPALPKILSAILGGIVTIATAISNYYKFGERSRNFFLASESLALECNKFDSRRGPYKDLEVQEALSLFMDRVEDTQQELTRRTLGLGKSEKDAH
jgi:Protein of unknown function (DUF4231)/LysM domain